MVIVSCTPYLSLLLCSNFLLLCMHTALVFYSSDVHWSLSSTLRRGRCDWDGAMQRGWISERMCCWRTDACCVNKKKTTIMCRAKKRKGKINWTNATLDAWLASFSSFFLCVPYCCDGPYKMYYWSWRVLIRSLFGSGPSPWEPSNRSNILTLLSDKWQKWKYKIK